MDLDSSGWLQRKTHFGNAGLDGDMPAVPKLLKTWHDAIGTYQEERECYLHQNTIQDVAYAVVPHLAARLSDLHTDRRQSVLDDLAIVAEVQDTPRSKVQHAANQIHETTEEPLRTLFIQSLWDRYPELPADLAPAYHAAIETAKELAGKTWGKNVSDKAGRHQYQRHLRFLRDCGVSDAEIVQALEALVQEPFAPVYQGRGDQVQALENLGWSGLSCEDTTHDKLRLDALVSLAFFQATLAKVLGELRP